MPNLVQPTAVVTCVWNATHELTTELLDRMHLSTYICMRPSRLCAAKGVRRLRPEAAPIRVMLVSPGGHGTRNSAAHAEANAAPAAAAACESSWARRMLATWRLGNTTVTRGGAHREARAREQQGVGEAFVSESSCGAVPSSRVAGHRRRGNCCSRRRCRRRVGAWWPRARAATRPRAGSTRA